MDFQVIHLQQEHMPQMVMQLFMHSGTRQFHITVMAKHLLLRQFQLQQLQEERQETQPWRLPPICFELTTPLTGGILKLTGQVLHTHLGLQLILLRDRQLYMRSGRLSSHSTGIQTQVEVRQQMQMQLHQQLYYQLTVAVW